LKTGTHVQHVEEAAPEIPESQAHEVSASVGSLFRLLRFARGHFGALALGIALTLATTAAGLVPPYLIKPIVDVLNPYQADVTAVQENANLSPADRAVRLQELRTQNRDRFVRAVWYLAAFVGAAIAAWGFGWAQGWVLACVSERISANLRNTTYEHL